VQVAQVTGERQGRNILDWPVEASPSSVARARMRHSSERCAASSDDAMGVAVMSSQPAAFLSYARVDDEYEDELVSQLRKRLSGAVRAQTGEVFPIFQDREDIQWGQHWRQRIEEALDAVTFLIPIMTPSFFKSSACREEVTRFLQREQQLGRQDLILPVYYISTPELDDPQRRETDELARVLASRQFADWRELRYEPFTSPVMRKALDHFAGRMRDNFWRPPPTSSSRPGGSRPAATLATRAGGTAAEPAGTVGPVAKTEPPTHVVDPFPNRGDFTTIGSAIEAARPGDRILVRPGRYQEGLVVDKPLEILGDGSVADIEVQSRGAQALLFKASFGRVANLTLRQAGGEGEWFGVDITQGRLELEGCDIASQSLSCVGIRTGADPRLRRNRIHNSEEVGVLILENGQGTLEDNDITANRLSGVQIQTGSNPTLRRNQIHDNKGSGVFIYENGQGTLEDNDITANRLSGVEIKTGSNPTLRRNQIHDNKQSGVWARDSTLGILEDNDISANSKTGVTIETSSNPTLRNNRIHNEKESGVLVRENGLGMLEDNDITANGYSGVTISSGGNPTLRRNRINRNNYAAVWVMQGGRGVIEDNDLTGNKGGSWTITKDAASVQRSGNRE
jgi:parallel beta-helix repeat protein